MKSSLSITGFLAFFLVMSGCSASVGGKSDDSKDDDKTEETEEDGATDAEVDPSAGEDGGKDDGTEDGTDGAGEDAGKDDGTDDGTDDGADDGGGEDPPPTTDVTPPTIEATVSATYARKDANGANLVLSATAADAGSGVDKVEVSVKKVGGSCLNTGKTAFDATCPAFNAASGVGTATFQLPTTVLTHTASYEVTWRATDKGGKSALDTGNFTWDGNVKLYLGIQDSSGGARIDVFTYDPSDNSITLGTPIDISADIGAGLLRGMADLPDGRIIAGNGGSNATALVDPSDGSVTSGPAMTGGSPALGNIHGICTLPNGHYIAGQYQLNKVLEFDETGAFVRDVYALTISSLTECVAANDTTLYLVDYDANGDSDGDIVKLTLDGGVWSVADTFDLSAASPGTNSSISSLVLHSSGDLYAPPQNEGGGRNTQMIKCADGDLDQCTFTGHVVMNSGEGFLQGAVQIPGDDDLLLVSGTRLMRYDVDTGAVTQIYDVDDNLSNVNQVRHLLAR